MNHQSKIRLKVNTDTGLNILCTAPHQWKVHNLYGHLTNLYKEVTQQENDLPANTQISIIKIMKDKYLIPRSQKIGQIFNDGDEITCNVSIKQRSNKKKRINIKREKPVEEYGYKQDNRQKSQQKKQKNTEKKNKSNKKKEEDPTHKPSNNRNSQTPRISERKNIDIDSLIKGFSLKSKGQEQQRDQIEKQQEDENM